MNRWFMAVFLICSVQACTSVLVGGHATSASDGRSGAEYQNDSRINAAVKSALIHDSQVDSITIRVSSVRGVVTLSGHQVSHDRVQRAVSLTRSIAGVRTVVSHLRVVKDGDTSR